MDTDEIADEIAELYRIALTWADGDKARAELLVRAYLRGACERWSA